MKKEIYYIILFFVVVILQVFVFNSIEVAGLVNAYIYIYILLILPIKFNHIALMFTAFTLGALIDMFSNTYGIHTFSTTLVAFLRPYLLKLFTTQEDIDKPSPSLHYVGYSVFIRYTLIFVFIHHLSLFVMEAFSFSNILFILLKTIVSSFITVLFILLTEKIFAK